MAAAALALEANFALVLGNVVGLTVNQQNRTVTQGIVSVNDLITLSPDTLTGIYTTQNTTLNAIQKSRLLALRAWSYHQYQHGAVIINVLGFTPAVCTEWAMRTANTTQGGDQRQRREDRPSQDLVSFSGQQTDWSESNRSLSSYLGQRRNDDGIPLSYVIRREEERPIVFTQEHQRRFWEVPLVGNVFNNDNFQVFQILRQWTSNSTLTSVVDSYEPTSDGRGAYLNIFSVMEGTDSIEAAVHEARTKIQTTQYHKDSSTRTFGDYCALHLSANAELQRRGHPFEGRAQVRYFIGGIKNPDFDNVKAMVSGKEECKADLQRAIIEFRTQLPVVTSYRALETTTTGRGQRRIGSTTTGDRFQPYQRGGRGRGRGRGYNSNYQGRGRGGGGRGGYRGGRGYGRGYGRGDTSGGRGDGRYGNRTWHSDQDGFHLPGHIMAELTPQQRRAFFTGRRQLRGDNDDNNNSNSNNNNDRDGNQRRTQSSTTSNGQQQRAVTIVTEDHRDHHRKLAIILYQQMDAADRVVSGIEVKEQLLVDQEHVRYRQSNQIKEDR